MARGMMTDKVKEKSMELLGREISILELRLLPYLQFVLLNGKIIEIRKINVQELNAIRMWQEEGHITGNIPEINVTKEFWDAMCEIIYIAYVAEE